MPNYGAVSLVCCFFLLTFGCQKQVQKPELIRTVVTAPVEPFDGTYQHVLSGVTQAAETSQLSFEIPGVIDSVKVNLGDRFQKGDVLATIEPKVFQLAVKQRKGQLSEVQARLKEAQTDLSRKTQLKSSGSVSQATLDVAKTQVNSLKDQVEIAKAQLELAQEDLADTQLIAPYAGKIAERHIEPSQRVTPSQPIFTIQGAEGIEVSVLVPENLVNQLHTGDTTRVKVFAATESDITGTIFEIGSQAQSANAFPVTVRLNSQNDALQPGMSAEVTFSYGDDTTPENAFLIPLTALGAGDKDTHFVWTVQNSNDQQIVKRKHVTLLELNKSTALVQGDLRAGLEVVRAGVEFLKENQRVNVDSGKPRLFNE
ncbi:efflux RND transporter periplasmic adaptor subunit [Alteromonas sp. ASW11-130]|uniref:efflux RND transporter periplasmic adaptor subunit n=1 Tax=Alteromonas sp. ASW11-130 TaxID=3015775 RepID=UPI002242626F|nr:efflux RND transporter periplasmic adaptor subunit [Alteromonas sp. ASW11-130]MCW8092743.1 efflux RND transporter periplasmic adaptor subunit [Alteromonas sp. ASW11-130]